MKDSAENPRFVETIGRRRYRFMVPVEPVSPLVGTGPPQPATESATPLRKPGQSKTLVAWIGAELAVFLLLAFFILRHRRQPDVTGSGAPRISSIAVLPLENLSNDPEQEYFVEGMTDEIITDLATALSCGFSLVPVSEAMPKAKAAAERALQLDPNLAEAHASLGLIAPFLNWNWAEAKEQYERAIELNPNYATAHHWYAEGYLIPRGRVDDALLQIRRAQELDPLSAVITTDMGKELYFARRYDEAIVELRRALDFDPNFVSVQSLPLAREGVRRKLVLHDFSEILVSLRRSPFQPALRGTTAPCRPSTMSPSSRQRGSSAGMECRA